MNKVEFDKWGNITHTWEHTGQDLTPLQGITVDRKPDPDRHYVVGETLWDRKEWVCPKELHVSADGMTTVDIYLPAPTVAFVPGRGPVEITDNVLTYSTSVQGTRTIRLSPKGYLVKEVMIYGT